MSTSETTSVFDAIEFLFTGADPIQDGVAAGTIEPVRVAVLRGAVRDQAGLPLVSVRVSALDHPELGSTLSRTDGRFDLAVNGGGALTLVYERAGLLPVQRTLEASWQDWVEVPDVVMTPLDPQATAVTGGSAQMQVAQGSEVTDADGTRQATMLFEPGTDATMTLADGSVEPLPDLTVRATELTVGNDGPQAMPGQLPPTSAYTYAVELSVDEALAAGATMVSFDTPVPVYVENFLDMPVGTPVPAGYYDRERARWLASRDGLVIAILSVSGGTAAIDVDGDGQADSDAALAALGIDAAERERLATLYAAGTELWRVPVTHFTPWDFNWPFTLPFGATGPGQPGPQNDSKVPDTSCECPANSTVRAETQSLAEDLDVVGTPFLLHYESERTPGRKDAYRLEIPVSGSTLPPPLKRIELSIDIAGRVFTETFTPQPNLVHTFIWDGQDAYGRTLQGSQTATVHLSYVYDARYVESRADFDAGFAQLGDASATGDSTRQEIAVSQEWEASVGPWDARMQGLGGWALDVHHAYDPGGRTLYLGDGSRRSVEGSVQLQALDVAAGLASVFGGFDGDGDPATEARLNQPAQVSATPNGGFVIADSANNRIRRVAPDGTITTAAGDGTFGFSGDGGPATAGRLAGPGDVAVGPDGSLSIADTLNNRIRRVAPGGTITTVAGGGAPADGVGDNGSATQARLRTPGGIAIAPDGTLFVADTQAHRVRRVGPDGVITTFAGTGTPGFAGDGGPATEAKLRRPTDVALTGDGGLLVADSQNNRVRRIGPDGRITTVAGGGAPASGLGDGGPATAAALSLPGSLAPGPNGAFYIADTGNERVRLVESDGTIETVAGGGDDEAGNGGLATAVDLGEPTGAAASPDGTLLVAVAGQHVVYRRDAALSGFRNGDILVPSEDASVLYHFGRTGRHLRTFDALTGAVLYQFAYTGGRLSAVTDVDGSVTTVERDPNGEPAAIVGPYGARTELDVNAAGYLSAVRNPANEETEFGYAAGGLLTSFADPRDNTSTMAYDANGRLISDDGPLSTPQTFGRSSVTDGLEVDRTTAAGREWTYRLERLEDGSQHRVVTRPDDTEVTSSESTDGSAKATAPDGTETTSSVGPDPRFGMTSPVQAAGVVSTPSGVTRTTEVERDATLEEDNPLSLASLTTMSSVNGRRWSEAYDGTRRVTVSTSPEGRGVEVTADEKGRPTLVAPDGLAEVAYDYDPRGRVTSATVGTGDAARVTAFAYNAQGDLQSFTDPLGRVHAFEYDAAGRVIKETIPSGREVLYDYDPNGNLTSFTPPGRPAHTFAADAENRPAAYTAPDVGPAGDTTTYAYDDDDHATRLTRAGNEVVTVVYDTAGKPATVSSAAGTYTYGYDSVTGQLDSVEAPGGEHLDYVYDGLLATGAEWSGSVTGSYSVAYNDDLDTMSDTISGTAPVAYAYDADRLLTQAGALSLDLDTQTGAVTATTLDQITTARTYNQFGEPETIQAKHAGTVLYAVEYERDKLGRVTQKTENVQGTPTVYGYEYDAAGRLQRVTTGGTETASYTYDPNGNRLSVARPGGVEEGTFDSRDRVLTYGGGTYVHDDAGDLVSKTGGTGTTTYSYDAFGNLRQATLPGGAVVEYVVDGQNRRVGKRVNGALVQGFLYSNQLRPAAELDGAGNVVSRFVYATGVNVPDYMVRGGTTYRLVLDELGSVRLVVNAQTGQVVQRLAYDEYGRVLEDTNPGFQPFGFAGGLYDPYTKLVRFGARDYDPATGRWTLADPVGFAGTTNMYSYIGGSPVNAIDPLGLGCFEFSLYVELGGGFTFCSDETGWSITAEAGAGVSGTVDYDFMGKPHQAETGVMGEASAKLPGLAGVGLRQERYVTPCGILGIRSEANWNVVQLKKGRQVDETWDLSKTGDTYKRNVRDLEGTTMAPTTEPVKLILGNLDKQPTADKALSLGAKVGVYSTFAWSYGR